LTSENSPKSTPNPDSVNSVQPKVILKLRE
jgi:hypothetical protein